MKGTSYRTQKGRSTAGGRKGGGDNRRLIQLVISLALFGVVLVGRGLLPERMEQASGFLRQVLNRNTNFAAAFSRVGDAIGNGESVLDTLGDFCVAVFGPSGQTSEPDEASAGESSLCYPEVRSRLTAGKELSVISLERSIEEENAIHAVTLKQQEITEDPSEEKPQGSKTEETASLPVGSIVKEINYTGDALPEHTSLAWLSLGNIKTKNPVDGVLTSTFSYRIHPISGAYAFHYGADLAAAMGSDIGAFAAGTVEFTGQSDGYGLYLQLDHGNGVKSFYAHCSRICVRQGQQVTLGEKIAEVGNTGNATGPHLHFQIKLNDTWLNPLYYITVRT